MKQPVVWLLKNIVAHHYISNKTQSYRSKVCCKFVCGFCLHYLRVQSSPQIVKPLPFFPSLSLMINYFQSSKYETQPTKKITPVDPGIYSPTFLYLLLLLLLQSVTLLLNTLMMTNQNNQDLDCSA